MQAVRFPAKSIPVAFALTTLLAYGLLLPLTGFYWDDWPFIWAAKFLGPAQFIPAFRGFRPFLGPIFTLTTSLLPADPILWQAFGLVIRCLSALALWFALSQIWREARRPALAAAFLFLVFPGYSQQWVALTHINQEWIPFIFYLLSIGFTLRALRSPGRSALHTAAALLLLIAGLFPTEYFIGLEPLRYLFIWVIVAEGTAGFWKRGLGALRHWWPYLAIWMADAAWLIYYYRSGVYVSYGVTAARQIPSAWDLLLAFGDAFWKAGLYVWVQVLVLCAQAMRAPTTLLTLGLTLAAFGLAAFFLFRLELPGGETRTQAMALVLIGGLGILLGRIPSLAAGLPLTLQSSYDRFMISMMAGGALFMTGALELCIRQARLRTYVLAALIALGIGQQFFNANIFRRDWTRQQEIYWQLAWRIPALKPDTVLLTDFVPIDYETDLSFTAPLNWIYAPHYQGGDLPYAMLYVNKRLGGSSLSTLQPGNPIELPYRTVNFEGSTSQAIVIYAPADNCLHVFDPANSDAQTYGKLAPSLTALIPLSDPARILPAAPAPALPDPPFVSELPHTWCYFYEKAELARQQGAWDSAAQLGHTAAAQGFSPQDMLEWLPFIEAYARTGDLTMAEQLAQRAWQADPQAHRGLCLLWKRVQAGGAQDARALASTLLTEWKCGR